jgi:hypothetical protein
MAGAGVGKFGFSAKIDPADGELDAGQFQVTHSTDNGSGLNPNSFRLKAVAGGSDGSTWIGGQPSNKIPERANLMINAQSIGSHVGGETGALNIASTYESRNRIVSFTGDSGGDGVIVDPVGLSPVTPQNASPALPRSGGLGVLSMYSLLLLSGVSLMLIDSMRSHQ